MEMEMKQEGMRLGLGLTRRFFLRLADKLPQRNFYAEFGKKGKRIRYCLNNTQYANIHIDKVI